MHHISSFKQLFYWYPEGFFFLNRKRCPFISRDLSAVHASLTVNGNPVCIKVKAEKKTFNKISTPSCSDVVCMSNLNEYLSQNKLLWVISALLIWTQSLFHWQPRRTTLSKELAIIHAANHAQGWQLGAAPKVCFHLGAIQTKPWVLSQVPNERSRELEVG